ncbi:MAG: EVE domain-containing protein [Gammaproteobacteria bacterium]
MAYWLMKSEPDEFSWESLWARGSTESIWDGVRNHQAAGFLRAMQAGHEAFFYHTGSERRIVGIMQVTRAAFPDPTDASGRFVSVGVRALRPLAVPVPLALLRADPAFTDCPLVRQPRLSVMPITPAHWAGILGHADAS